MPLKSQLESSIHKSQKAPTCASGNSPLNSSSPPWTSMIKEWKICFKTRTGCSITWSAYKDTPMTRPPKRRQNSNTGNSGDSWFRCKLVTLVRSKRCPPMKSDRPTAKTPTSSTSKTRGTNFYQTRSSTEDCRPSTRTPSRVCSWTSSE